ncbi:NADPH-dependent F420 reductase [Demequina activiva]|uniref:NADP oxidoreductase n=1 Tax=Demequina activiva TaxID=1582364 RepID=A0A919Q4U1_9MICO|nr:NAD(P)-binding domain-containing protein [Demequina activiva]GIG55187.1 NADP oxidoreductase [Demequina activiva]
MTTIGIIGSGNIGSNVAKAAVEHGFDVVISNSRGPDTLQDLVSELGDRATAGTTEESIRRGDLVLVAIPLKAIGALPVEPFEDKIVMDANNYYPQRDGRIEALDSNESTTSELLQKHLPHSHVVKAFNNINAKDIPADGLPKGSADRRALTVAGNTDSAKDAVAHFIDALGYDVLDLGGLDQSWKVERDTPAYGKRANLEELKELTTDVERVQQV